MVEDKLARLLREKQAPTVLMLSPVVMKMPLVVKRYDDPFLPFGQRVIRATRDLLCGYLYDFTKYLALGAAGAIALERTIAYAGTDMLNILHGPFAHPDFIDLTDQTAFNADGLTITPGLSITSPRPDRTIFVVEDARLLGAGTQLAIAGDEVLYVGSNDEYETKLRQAVERFNGAT